MRGHWKFADGKTGWCKPVLDGEAVSIDFDDGSYTVVPLGHWRLQGAVNLTRCNHYPGQTECAWCRET